MILRKNDLTLEKAWITDNALIITLVGTRLSAAYLFELLTSAKLNEKANKSAQPLITGEMVKALKVAVPPSKAQALACDQISVIRNQFNRLTRRIDESLFRLREFRAALITAAVTGQIDVATWGKCGTTDQRLDEIEAEMAAAASPEREKARAWLFPTLWTRAWTIICRTASNRWKRGKIMVALPSSPCSRWVSREFLDRGDDDPRTVLDGLLELAGCPVDLSHHPARLLELRNRALKLPVEHDAVGDDDHRVEDRVVGLIMEVDRLMGGPADCVRFAGTGGMLDQVGTMHPNTTPVRCIGRSCSNSIW